MNGHIDRMEIEYKELSDKILSLTSFIKGDETFKKLGCSEQLRMVKQLAYMESYANILSSRIFAAR